MDKTAILFSGGRDSCVLLHIVGPWLDEITVLWVNTGAAYESTLQQMREVRSRVPHFHEIKTDQPTDIHKWGFPVDILPTRHDIQLLGTQLPKLQTTFSCCSKNIWWPIKQTLAQLEIKYLWSGGREDELTNDPRWIEEIDGVKYKYPLRKWTQDMVLSYIKKHNISVPSYYEQGETKSRDCWNCTGYLFENQKRIANLPFYQREEMMDRLAKIEQVIDAERALWPKSYHE